MTYFPEIDTVPFTNPVVEELQWKTLITEFDELGEEQRKQKNLFPKRLLSLKYKWLTKAQGEFLYRFYVARAGAFGSFKFFLPAPRGVYSYSYEKEYVGTGDGATKVFNMPSKGAGAYTLYVDDSVQSLVSDYNLTLNGGPDGEDKVTFVDAPNAGLYITWTFTGRLKIVCRFKNDKLSFESFMDRLVSVGIQLQGLLNDA